MARYFLVGSLTWAIPKERTVEVQELQEEDDEDKEGWVAIKPPAEEDEADQDQAVEDEETEGEEELQEDETESQEEKEHDLPRHGLTDAEEEAGEDLVLHTPPGPGEFEDLADELQAYEVKVFRMAIPMHSKKAKEVTRATMELILKLRMDGYSVNKIHVDQGHEFAGHIMDWTRRRGIVVTKTAGDEPQSNGRAELSVKVVKNMVRKALTQAEEGAKWWPWALRHSYEVLRCRRIHEPPSFSPFMTEVLVRRRRWKKEDFSPSMEKVRYLAPSPENHGHWVVPEGGSPRLTRCIIQKMPTGLLWRRNFLVDFHFEGDFARRPQSRGFKEEKKMKKERHRPGISRSCYWLKKLKRSMVTILEWPWRR